MIDQFFSVLGIAADHRAAFVALMLTWPLCRVAVAVLRRLTRRGYPPAVRFIRGLYLAGPFAKLTALLLAATGFVHLALPLSGGAHGGGRSLSFVLFGLAALAAAYGVMAGRRWRRIAVPLLAAGLLSYALVIGGGSEEPDQLGLVTKLIEVTALTLALVPVGAARPISAQRRSRRRWALAGVAPALAMILVGGAAWGAENRAHSHARHPHDVHHHGEAGPPTPAQQAAAARLQAETRAALERYLDPEVARADGYRPLRLGERLNHWENPARKRDGVVLDPSRPEMLVYTPTDSGPLLLGAVFVMPYAGVGGPTPGGALTSWHDHGLCLSPVPPFIVGITTPFGVCPAGSAALTTSEMMHVWVVDNPKGAFSEEFDEATLQELVRSHTSNRTQK